MIDEDPQPSPAIIGYQRDDLKGEKGQDVMIEEKFSVGDSEEQNVAGA